MSLLGNFLTRKVDVLRKTLNQWCGWFFYNWSVRQLHCVLQSGAHLFIVTAFYRIGILSQRWQLYHRLHPFINDSFLPEWGLVSGYCSVWKGSLRQAWRNFSTRAQNGTRKDFFGTQHSLLSQYLLLLCPTSITILWTLCVYIHTYDTVQTVYELPFLPNNTAAKHLYTNRSGEKCCLDIYRWDAWLDQYVTLGRTFYRIILEHELVAAQLLPHFVTYRIPRGGLN